jgi:hypothetical protein
VKETDVRKIFKAVVDPNRIVARRVRDLRLRLRDWNAQHLAQALNAAGLPWTRGTVTKLETGRREAVSVAELLAAALGLMLVVLMTMSLRSVAPRSAGTTGAAPVTPAEHSASAPAATPVLTVTGSGDQATPDFTTAASWSVDYSFDCTGHGAPGNFIVQTQDPAAWPLVDVIDLKGTASVGQDGAGVHHLVVTSPCSWSVTVLSAGAQTQGAS